MSAPNVAAMEEVRALRALDLRELRLKWKERYGCPPTFRSTELLRRVLAWRIQEEAFGGLDSETKRLLRRSSERVSARQTLTQGTVLRREWKGVVHEVTVTADGFAYGGKSWKSLLVIATEIAGSRWNGPRFFGLREG